MEKLNALLEQRIKEAKYKLYAFLLLVGWIWFWFDFWQPIITQALNAQKEVKNLQAQINSYKQKIEAKKQQLKNPDPQIAKIYEILPSFTGVEVYQYALRGFFEEVASKANAGTTKLIYSLGGKKQIKANGIKILAIEFDKPQSTQNPYLAALPFELELEVPEIATLLKFLKVLKEDYAKLKTPLVVQLTNISYDILRHNQLQTVRISGKMYFVK